MNEVTVHDVKMPFFSMVVFLIKLAFAAIPAIIVVWTTFFFLMVATYLFASALGWGIGKYTQSANPTPTPAPVLMPLKK